MNKILITPRSLSKNGHSELDRLVESGYQLIMPTPGVMPSTTELIDAVEDCVGWLAGVEPITAEIIDAAPKLRVISRNGTGIDNLPLELLRDRNIAVRKAEGANARGVAELALTLIFAGLRHLRVTDAGIRAEQWPRKIGREMGDVTIGIIGMGAVGETLARLCLTLGAKVIGYDPFKSSALLTEANFKQLSFDQLIAQSDVISLHAPMPANGQALFDASTLQKTKPGLVLVNTARAQLVDEAALLEAINRGQVANYATDVFATEPPKITPLYAHDASILSSHIGGFTDASVRRATAAAVDGLLEILQ